MIRDDDLILFQGDSITAAGRDQSVLSPNEPVGLGSGYVARIAEHILDRPEPKGLHVINRGVSGDRVSDLAIRWKADCLYQKPNVLSILIGVNDTWGNMKSSRDGTSLEEFEKTYRYLLDKVNRLRPKVGLVLCEPFVVFTGEVTSSWFPEFDERRAIVYRLANDYGAVFVAFQDAINKAAEIVGPSGLCGDGVHPTAYGHELLAETWIKTVMASELRA